MILLLILLFFLSLVWLLIRFVPLIISRVMNRNSGMNQREKRKEGEVYVSSEDANAPDKVVEKNMGEYVDFEQVKEEK